MVWVGMKYVQFRYVVVLRVSKLCRSNEIFFLSEIKKKKSTNTIHNEYSDDVLHLDWIPILSIFFRGSLALIWCENSTSIDKQSLWITHYYVGFLSAKPNKNKNNANNFRCSHCRFFQRIMSWSQNLAESSERMVWWCFALYPHLEFHEPKIYGLVCWNLNRKKERQVRSFLFVSFAILHKTSQIKSCEFFARAFYASTFFSCA